jgi:hypothetical protein
MIANYMQQSDFKICGCPPNAFCGCDPIEAYRRVNMDWDKQRLEAKVKQLEAELAIFKEQLAPCPCCQGKAKFEDNYVICDTCQLRTPIYECKEHAIRAWNKRP